MLLRPESFYEQYGAECERKALARHLMLRRQLIAERQSDRAIEDHDVVIKADPKNPDLVRERGMVKAKRVMRSVRKRLFAEPRHLPLAQMRKCLPDGADSDRTALSVRSVKAHRLGTSITPNSETGMIQ